jgi:hypothetical protein
MDGYYSLELKRDIQRDIKLRGIIKLKSVPMLTLSVRASDFLIEFNFLKYMTSKLQELLNTQQIGEPEIIDLLLAYNKMVNAELFSQKEFDLVLERLGITKDNDTFILTEDVTYTLI